MPLEWLSNYEKFHQNSQPVQTSDALFEKRADGTVRMTFQPPTEQTPPTNETFIIKDTKSIIFKQNTIIIKNKSCNRNQISTKRRNIKRLFKIQGITSF